MDFGFQPINTLDFVWILENLVERKKFRKVIFFLVFGLEKNHKENKYGGKFGGKIVRNK